MRRSVPPICQLLPRPSWPRLPSPFAASRSSPLTVRRFSSASSSSSTSSSSFSSSSPSSSPSSHAPSTDPSLYSSSHLTPSSYRPPTNSSHSPQPTQHTPYVAYQTEYDDTTQPTADTEPTNTPTPHTTSTAAAASDETADGRLASSDADQTMVSAINQLTIEGVRNESATGPATIHNKPLHAKYKPTSRKAINHHITTRQGSLTTLQLHRLLSLYALTGGSDVAQQQEVAARLAGRFGVDVGKVEQLVQAMAAGRVYNDTAERGGVDAVDNGEDKCAVWREEEVPPGKHAVVQGAHLVTHLQAWERDNGKQL